MSDRCLITAVGIALAAGLMMTVDGARASDDKYPDWKGQWERFVVRGIPGQPNKHH